MSDTAVRVLMTHVGKRKSQVDGSLLDVANDMRGYRTNWTNWTTVHRPIYRSTASGSVFLEFPVVIVVSYCELFLALGTNSIS